MVVSVALLSLPAVQTKIAKIVTNKLNKTYNTNIMVSKVDLSYLGNVSLKGVQIDDHHNDTLIYVNQLTTSVFSYKNILDNKLEFGEIDVEGLQMYMKTYRGEENDNLSIFIDKFDDGDDTPSETPFLLTSSKLNIDNGNFYLFDENKQEDAIVYYKKITGIVDNFNNTVKDLSIIAYPLKTFSEQTVLKELIIDSEKTVLLVNKENYFYTTYKVPNGLVMHIENSSFPPVLGDNEGNEWNAFGYAISGPRKGHQLQSSKSYIASWWAFKDFFKEKITIKN